MFFLDIAVVGGHPLDGDLTVCRLFDADTEQWSGLPSTTVGRGFWPAVAVVRRKKCHRIYVFGGRDGGWRLDSCEFLDVDEDQWTLLGAKMARPRSSACAVLLDDTTIVICGGASTYDKETDSCESLDLNTHTFSPFPDMLAPRYGHAAVRYNETIVALGGHDKRKTCEQFDPAVCKWTPFPPLSEGRAYPGAAVVENNIYVAGDSMWVDMYDGAVWERVMFLPPRREHCTAVALGGKLVVLGGGSVEIDIVDPATRAALHLPSEIQCGRRCTVAVSF